MTRLRDLVAEEVRRCGPLTVARYMDLALYHPEHGYYVSGARRTGRAGHFLTSPELDPGFGALWGRAFASLWERSGHPRSFCVIEVGPGEGGFAAGVLSSASGPFAAALAYRLVERAPALRRRQAKRLGEFERVSWSSELESAPPAVCGVVVANEVLDNLPVHVVEGPEEIFVTLTPGGALAEVKGRYTSEVASLLARHGVEVPAGTRVEVPVASERFVRACVALVERGGVVLIDYGDEWDGLLRRRAGTLVCYSPAGADADYLAAPGAKDVTSHANWSVVRGAFEGAGLAVAGPVPQREVLRRLGVERLQEHLRAEARVATAAGRGRRAVRALSRRGALAALTDPGGLGALGVLTASTPGVGRDEAGLWGPAS